MMKKYTYKEWLYGKIILKYDCIIQKGRNPILVEWGDFKCDEDILLIKKKQKEIFNERVTNLLEKFKSFFKIEIEASQEFEVHCRMTLNQIDTILKGVLPQMELIPTEYWNCVFFYKDLCEIQEYYRSNLIRGVEVDYSFINSPTMDYQRQDENPHIYAHTLYLFHKWIETEQAKQADTKTDKLKAPVIALFCSVLNDAGIIRKIETESVQTYCKRVCDVFKFTYKIRIGKAFYNSDNKANKDKIKNLILPLIDLETSKSVSDYLDNKQPIKQKLFG
jgi:hypothetical protein